MKRFIAVMIALMSVCMASAKSVVFTLSNNTKVYYLLGGEKNPVMKFVDGKLVVNTDTYEFSKIKNFVISEEDDPTVIKAVAKASGTFDGKVLVVEAEAKDVKVFDMSGAEVDAQVDANGGLTTVNLSNNKKGVYVVRVGQTSFKVMKK